MFDIEGILEVVDGTWEEPIIDKKLEEWKTWKGWDKMTRLEILLYVDDKQQDNIQRLTTTIAMWENSRCYMSHTMVQLSCIP